METPTLRIRNLSVDIRTPNGVLNAVSNLSLTARAGKTLAIVGESGSGKSLTAMAMIGLLPKQASVRAETFEFQGQKIDDLTGPQIRALRGRAISFVFQDPMTAFDPCYTMGGQMMEIVRQNTQLTAAQAKARVLECLELALVPSPTRRFGQYPHELSGGLRQRVMIATALLCKPQLIIADEPTTALDVTTQIGILRLLDGIRRKSGISLIVITHDIGVVAAIADDIAVMYLGEVVEYGSTDDILARPLHPYTEGLLQSVPKMGTSYHDGPLGYIRGVVPTPINLPTGCHFASRCPYVTEACLAAPIAMRPVNDRHAVRCILPLDGTGRDASVWREATV